MPLRNAPSNAPCLVIVNDDPTQLAMLATLLSKEGYDVRDFRSVETALLGLTSAAPALFITDLNMPEIDGWRFCRLLRSPEYAQFNQTPILVASATFTGQETERITLELGADAFLTLPCDNETLINTVKRALRRESNLATPRILLVEDSRSLTNLLRKAFAAQGYHIDSALNAAQAAALFQNTAYDFVVLDYHLPDVQGDVLLAQFKTSRPDAVYIMITTDPRPELALAWLKGGASAYVRKPFDPEYLLTLCERAHREKALLRTAAVLEGRARQLRERETLVTTVISSAPMLTAILNADGVFTFCEGRALEELRARPGHRAGASLYQVYDAYPDIHAAFRQALSGDIVHVSAAFGPREFDMCFAPIPEITGTIRGIVLVATDVTERRQTEEILRRQQEQLHGIASSLPGVVYQIALRANGAMEVVYVGRQANAFLGAPPEPGRLFEQFLERLAPGEGERLMASITHAAEKFTRWDFEGQFIKPSGQIMWLKAIAEPSRAGEDILFNGILLDITAEKLAEQTQRESEERYSAIFNNAHDAIFIHDLDGNVLDVNQTMLDLYGVCREEARQMRILEHFSAADAPPETLSQAWERVLKGEQASFEWNARAPHTGDVFPVEVWLQRIHIGAQAMILANVRDIHERKRTEEMVRLRLHLTQYAATHSLLELLQEALDEISRVTGSAIGFYHFVEADQKTLSLQAWSTRTLREFCTAKGSGLHYSLDEAGVWADCIRERRPVIHNDYGALVDRKGMPPGHAAVTRELLIPVIRNGLVVAALGLGNKAENYTERDVETGSFLSDVVWEIVQRKRAEDAQEESQNLLQAALAQSPAGIIVADAPNVAIRWVNAAAMRIRGAADKPLTEQELTLHSSRWQAFYPDGAIYPPDDLPLSRAVSKGETTKNEELIVQTLSGEKRWLSLNAAPILDREGTITAGIAIFSDITEHKNAEEFLRLNTERTQALLRLNQMGESPLQHITDYVLEEAVRLTKSKIGYLAFLDEDESVLTMHSWSRSAMAECAIVDKPFFYPLETTGLWGEAVRQRRPILTNDYRAPNPLKKGHPDGHVALHRHMNVPIFSGSRIVALAGVGNKDAEYTDDDVQQLTLLMEGMWGLIERKQASEALAESEARFRYLSEAAFEGIMVHEDGIILDVNQKFAELFGYEAPAELIGKNGLDLLLDEASRAAITAPSAEAANDLMEIAGIRKNGSAFPGEIQSRGIVYRGRPARVAAMRDITERKKAEQEQKDLETRLLQSQKLESIGQLAGGVAHDFNNILAAVLGYAELALDEIREGHPLYEYISEIVKAGNHARDLTRQLLAFARKQTLELHPLDLNEVIRGFEKMLRRTLRENVAITVHLAPSPLPLLGDIGQIEQIVLNMAINAQDAMPNGGTLFIETQEAFLDTAQAEERENLLPGRHAMLCIADTGAGMDRETMARIFDPFFTTKGMGKGTGLGLSTVYGIVKQHKGSVSVESEPGKGACFHVYFPIGETAPPNSLPAQETGGIRGGSETILVVEDEATVRSITCKMIRQLGYAVLDAESGARALEAVQSHVDDIDLVLSDVIMPDINGRELHDRIVLLRPGLKFLYMSGYTADVISRQGVLEQGMALIQKPFSIRQLAARLRETLDERPGV